MWHLVKCFRLITFVWLSVNLNVNGPSPGVRVVRAKPMDKPPGLYSVDDDVIILNRTNFKDRVYGKSMIWLIEFYNSWCGHCIHYAPTWKKFASDLKGWRRVVSVGAMDCASEENVEVCREYNIEAYPSIQLFPPGFQPDKDKSKLMMMEQDPHDIKMTVLGIVTAPKFTAPSVWPRLSPLSNCLKASENREEWRKLVAKFSAAPQQPSRLWDRSVGDIWDEATDEHTFVVLVFEEEKSLVGSEVILDLVDFPSLLVRRMQKKDVEKFGTFTYPSLYIINRDSSFQLLASGSQQPDKDRPAFVAKLLSLLHIKDSEGKRIKVKPAEGGSVVQFQQQQQQQQEEVDKVENQVPALAVSNGTASKGVHLQDLESALYYTFRQEVAICKTIRGSKLDALRNFVSTLAKYFPGRAPVSKFLWKLVERLSGQNENLTGEKWVKMIDDLQDKEAFLPEQILWVECRGSQPRYRGYPCGMWTLFHTLTVGAYEHTGTAVNAQEVPLAIRGYMQHFFGCKECSKNFVGMASTLEQEIHRPLDAVLWLWSAHNRANKRLHGDASEDPQHPKVQFPSAAECPQCHSAAGQSLVVDPHPGWNVSAVALYLVRFYGKDAIIHTTLEEVQDGKGRSSGPKEMDWWEKRQREDDLKKIWELRNQKKQQKLEKQLASKDAEREKQRLSKSLADGGKAADSRKHADVIKESVRNRRLGDGWGLNGLDMGVCLIFYVSCAVIILILYYHFMVQRRFRLPCKSWTAV